MKKEKRLKLMCRRFIFIILSICLFSGIYNIFIAGDRPNAKKNVDIAQSNDVLNEEEKNSEVKDNTEDKFKKEPEKVIYLTFDDGPYKNTPELLDLLDKYNVKATFFVTAQFMNEEELIEMIKEIDERGHEVGVHTYSHRYDEIYSSVDAYINDYKKMDDIIYKATGKRSKIFRFPGGSNTGYNEDFRDELISTLENMGLTYYDWNAYNGDSDGLTAYEQINKAVTESSYTNKSIVLMHDAPGKEEVLDTLPSIIEQLQEKGYEFHALNESVEPIQFN